MPKATSRAEAMPNSEKQACPPLCFIRFCRQRNLVVARDSFFSQQKLYVVTLITKELC